MKLKTLFKEIPVVWKGNKELEITSITANSKTVAPGALFLAKRGIKGDGHRFIAEAVAAGAAAVLTDTYDPFLSTTQIIYLSVNDIESILGHRFYDNPSQKLALIGVTGTSGKTTTTFLIQYLLKNCGLVGTVTCMTGKKVLPSTLTSPDLLSLLQLFHEMKEDGCTARQRSRICNGGLHQPLARPSRLSLDHGRVCGCQSPAFHKPQIGRDHQWRRSVGRHDDQKLSR
jgi:UDP-N-acetylmuramoyl-L-alanyl-D-glutamate--2,6-diaminopimelate ligase